MFSKKYFILSIVLIFLVIFPLFSILGFSTYYLIIKVNDKVVLMEKIDGSIVIKYFFMHSSEKTPWIEYWIATSNGIYVEKLCWTSGGAGHPSNPQDFSNHTFIVEYEKFYCALGIKRYLGNYVLVDLGHAYNASLVIGKNIINCKHGSNYLVELSVRKINVLEDLLIKLSLNTSILNYIPYYTYMDPI